MEVMLVTSDEHISG